MLLHVAKRAKKILPTPYEYFVVKFPNKCFILYSKTFRELTDNLDTNAKVTDFYFGGQDIRYYERDLSRFSSVPSGQLLSNAS
jgi:hypothetical protein